MINVATIFADASNVYIATKISVSENSGSNLRNYAVRVLLGSDWKGWDYVKPDVSNVFVVDSNKVGVPFWIERADVSGKEMWLWFKVSGLDANGSKTYFICVGKSVGMSQLPSDVFVFFDDFELFSGWLTYGSGVVSSSSVEAFNGAISAHKTSNNDPNGAYKEIGTTIGRDYVLEAWVYRPTSYSGGGQDRVGLIDDSGNGYGFAFDHSLPGLRNDVRSSYSGTQSSSVSVSDIRGAWYLAQLIVKSDGTIISRVYDASLNEVGSLTWSNTSYSSFTRVYIFGGYDYYVDCMRVRPYVEPEPSVNVLGYARNSAEADLL